MDPIVQKRLLVRLGMIWTAKQRKRPIDINPFIQKLSAKMHETYPDIDVFAAHGNIEIRNLDTVSSKAQVFVLDKVCRLADIFQRQVVTYDDLPVLHSFDFVRNKGRNKDYSVSERFRRPARRRS
jgi:hypothetical protein